ncbi:GNAT family N-acetyltransferase [Amycolatopsis keratiniphila]|uniref:Acetyltransferase n=1 Tax=Amycolatopsis keratiniphila TaxID=129921 RepID=R4T0F6_9PSEU|nr:GNAT family N-acetyltransferase [Amycolatopsis keratiniphila]AGM04472.1 acetyltransferase [Amycolatopsis keratiniphila]
MTSSHTVSIRQAGEHDVPALAALRRAWTEEQAGQPVDDDGFEERFAGWYAAEASRRSAFLAELDGEAVGMVNLALIERMPRPGIPATRWAYLGNAFVLATHRDREIGSALVDAATAHARVCGCDRIVLSPTERSVPFYRRAGFGPATMLLARVLDEGRAL